MTLGNIPNEQPVEQPTSVDVPADASVVPTNQAPAAVELTTVDYNALLENQTPNVALANPHVRLVVQWILGIGGILVPTLAAIDSAAPAFDISGWINPAAQGLLALTAVYGLAVTQRNIPRV